jgi:hypothetical protein
MKLIKVTTDVSGHALMEAAANYAQIPLSIWARAVLLKEARSIEHKILCTPKSAANGDIIKTYRWAGKDCTKEEMEEGEAREALMLARHAKRLADADMGDR